MSSSVAVADTISKLISENAVMVFSKSYCPYCAKAKRILSQYTLKSYKIYELDQIADGDSYQESLHKLTGARSVPRVFIGGKCIGGGDDTEKLDKSGELKGLLEGAGAL